MFVVRLLTLFILILSCAPQEEDDSEKNFNVSPDQLGKVSFVNGDLDFGPVPIGTTHERLIQIKNTGKLPISDFETFFDDEEFSLIFRYSGSTAEFPGENGTCGVRLEVGDTCLLSISYLPTTSTTYDIEFKLRYKDGLDTSTSAIRVKSFSGTNGELEVTPDIVNFGDIDLNDYQTVIVDLKNNGELDLEILRLELFQDDGLYNLDFNHPQNTCPSTGIILKENETCKLAVSIDTSLTTTYDDYFAFYEIEFKEAPTAATPVVLKSDIRAGVYSLEGILETTPLLSYQDVISGSERLVSFQVRNVGHNAAVIKTINDSMVDPSLNFLIDTTDCTNLSNELFAAPGEVIIPQNTICILNARLNPDVSMSTQILNYANLNITYDNLKSGLVNTPDFELDADVIKSGFIETLDESDNPIAAWNTPSTFISGDSRIFESQNFKFAHSGETPVTFVSFNLSGQGSEYLSLNESCNTVLNLTEDCGFSLTLTPSLSIYNTISELNINSVLTVTYTDESIDSNNDFIERQITFPINGTIDLRSMLVFEEFDSGASRTNSAVATTAIAERIYVRNIGALSEDTFSLQNSNAANFSSILTTLVDGDGVRNCQDMIGLGVALNPQEQCFFEIRSFSGVTGDVSTQLNVDFDIPNNTTDPYDLTTSFVGVAEIGAVNSSHPDKVTFITYNGSYPGPGSVTPHNDASVSRMYSSNATVDSSQITINSSIATTFDLAIVDSGYGETGSTDIVSLNIGNSGEFNLGINSVSVISGAGVYRTNSSCNTGTILASGSECQVSLDINYVGTSLELTEVEIRYTLGDKAFPDDPNFIEYTTVVKVYNQGYDASLVANLNMYQGVVPLTNLDLITTVGPENTVADTVRIQNDGVGNATDIHYALVNNGTIVSLTGAPGEEISFPNFTQGVAPIEEYQRNNTSPCTNAGGNDINVSGFCDFDIAYQPNSFGDTIYEVMYRYNNGVTYVSETFQLTVEGLRPASLEFGEVLGSFPLYSYDFEEQVIDQTYTHEISVTNTGETDAVNFSHPVSGAPFGFENSSTTLPTCGTTIAVGTTCYLNLTFSPVFADIGTERNNNFLATYENGEISGGSNVIATVEMNVIGFTENIRSRHYGWDEIYSIGYNQDYADELNLNPANNYDPEDLGYISFSWYSMDDADGDADRYFIFKSDQDDIDIYNDSPHAIITRDGSSIYSYEDRNILNIPLRVWYYKIVPEKNGAISQIRNDDYPISTLRLIIPNKFESLVHKYMINRDICKTMELTDTTLPSFDPMSNGCEYLDQNSIPTLVNHDYDLAVDMFETSGVYVSTNTLVNTPGEPPVEMNFQSALTHCESKAVNYSSSEPFFSSSFQKTLPSRIEHLTYAAKLPGESYVASDCDYDPDDRLTGQALDCQSKFLIEQGVGGIPEWTTSEVDGYGEGITTTYTGFTDDLINNIDYTRHFQNVSGVNYKYLKDPASLPTTCFNLATGIVEKAGGLGCVGENFAMFTDDPGSAGPKLYDISNEPDNTRFTLWHFNADLSTQNITVNVQAGGGESLGQAIQNNSSIYTTEFVPSVSPRGAARCVTRIPYQ